MKRWKANCDVSSLAAKTFAYDELQKGASTAEAEAKTLESAVEAARLIVGQRQSEKDTIANEVAEVRGQFGAQQERSNATKRNLAEYERSLHETQSQIRQKENQLERAVGEDKEIVLREANAIAQLSELQSRREALEANLTHSRSERAKTLEKVGEIGLNLKTTRETLHTSEEELHRVEVRLAATIAEMSDMERRLRDEFGIGALPPKAEPSNDASDEEIALFLEELEKEEEAIDENSLEKFLSELAASIENEVFNRRAVLAEIEELSRKSVRSAA